ncbi:hypothetical protein HRbin33_02655 [bacterium HR33]|nr:hypothetical protein HRbin33_02655 [bacterium HR33]
MKRRCLALLLWLVLGGFTAARASQQPEGRLWLQGKVIGGLGLVAEGELGSGITGSVGAGWFVLLVDGFAGVGWIKGPVGFFGRVHVLLGPELDLFGTGGGGGLVTVAGLEPGVRLRLLGRWLALEAGAIAIPEWEEVFEWLPDRNAAVSRGRRLRFEMAPNVGLLVRLGRI